MLLDLPKTKISVKKHEGELKAAVRKRTVKNVTRDIKLHVSKIFNTEVEKKKEKVSTSSNH